MQTVVHHVRLSTGQRSEVFCVIYIKHIIINIVII
jgi:hypothetical protein